MRRYRFSLTVTTITADHDEATDIQAAAADALNASPAIESVMVGPLTSEPVTSRPCRAGGEIFYTPTIPPVPQPDSCHGHWYAEQLDAARPDRSLPAADRRAAPRHRAAQHRVAVGRDDHDAATGRKAPSPTRVAAT